MMIHRDTVLRRFINQGRITTRCFVCNTNKATLSSINAAVIMSFYLQQRIILPENCRICSVCKNQSDETDACSITALNTHEYWEQHLQIWNKSDKSLNAKWFDDVAGHLRNYCAHSEHDKLITDINTLQLKKNEMKETIRRMQKNLNMYGNRRIKGEEMEVYHRQYTYTNYNTAVTVKHNKESEEYKDFQLLQKGYSNSFRNVLVYRIMSNVDCKNMCGVYRENIRDISVASEVDAQIVFALFYKFYHAETHKKIYSLFGWKETTFSYWWNHHVEKIYHGWGKGKLVHGDPDLPQTWDRKRVMLNSTKKSIAVWEVTDSSEWVDEDETALNYDARNSQNSIVEVVDGGYLTIQSPRDDHELRKKFYSQQKHTDIAKIHVTASTIGKFIEIDVFFSDGHHNDRTIEEITTSLKYIEYCLDAFQMSKQENSISLPDDVQFTEEQARKYLYMCTKIFNETKDVKIADNGYTSLGKDCVKTPIEEAKAIKHNSVMAASFKRRITMVREIVERLMRILKCWKILNSRIHHSIIPKIRWIVTIVAAIHNEWGPPMFSQDKKTKEFHERQTKRFLDVKDVYYNPASRYIAHAVAKCMSHLYVWEMEEGEVSASIENNIEDDSDAEEHSDDEESQRIYIAPPPRNIERISQKNLPRIEQWTKEIKGFDKILETVQKGKYFQWLRRLNLDEEALKEFALTSFQPKLAKDYVRNLDDSFSVQINMVNPFVIQFRGIQSMWRSSIKRTVVLNFEYIVQAFDFQSLSIMHQQAMSDIANGRACTLNRHQLKYITAMKKRDTDPHSPDFWDPEMDCPLVSEYDPTDMDDCKSLEDFDAEENVVHSRSVNSNNNNNRYSIQSQQVWPDGDGLDHFNEDSDKFGWEAGAESGRKNIAREIESRVKNNKKWRDQDFDALKGKFKYLQWYCICNGGSSVMHPCGHGFTVLLFLIIALTQEPDQRKKMLKKYRGRSRRNQKIRANVTNLEPAKEWIKQNDPMCVCYCTDKKGKRMRMRYGPDGVTPVDLLNAKLIHCDSCGVWVHGQCALSAAEDAFWWDDGKPAKRGNKKNYFCPVCIAIPTRIQKWQLQHNKNMRQQSDEQKDVFAELFADSNAGHDPFVDMR